MIGDYTANDIVAISIARVWLSVTNAAPVRHRGEDGGSAMRWVAVILAAVFLGNGAFMLVSPKDWFAAIPGVAETGPYNSHLVRDVGIAYGVAGLATLWGAFGGGWRCYALALAFIGAHAVLHVIETLSGHAHAAHHGPTLLNDVA
ncbi:MAG TPA: hypothetical protein DCL48_07790, partial [Alphaproteobacteria bacterium]|nr:hypothetical protein [Alphaproteobacteria bacterium]